MSRINKTECGIEYRITPEGIEIGVDPSYDHDYSHGYCTTFTLDELERLLESIKTG
tara:strand:- start:152 stop:319 length:168 start_codon:yes stop_codon:yes gene_type:complete